MRKALFGVVLFLFFGAPLSSATVDNPAPGTSTAETEMALRVEQIVIQIGGVSKAWVWVKIEPDLQRWQDFVKSLNALRTKTPARAIPRSVDIMPGVNADELAGMIKGKEQSLINNANRAASNRAPNYDNAVQMADWFKRTSVRVAVPDTITPARMADVKAKVPILLGLNAQKGDTFILQTFPAEPLPLPAVPLPPKKLGSRIAEWLGQITPAMLFIAFCVLAAIFFFFGPIRAFLRDAAQALQVIRVQSQTSGSVQSKSESQVDGESVAKGTIIGKDGKPIPDPVSTEEQQSSSRKLFAFITDEMFPNLVQICQAETDEHVAMLASYLKPALAGRLLAALEPFKRQEVLKHFSQASRFTPDEVIEFAQGLEKTINFVSGGSDRLLQLLEEMSPTAQTTVMQELDLFLPDIAALVRPRLMTYMDLFRMERKSLQKVLWEAHRQKVALPVIFASVSAKGQEYLIQQLPDSIAAIIREETRTVGKQTADRVEQEGRKLLQVARVLEKKGEIGALKHNGEKAA